MKFQIHGGIATPRSLAAPRKPRTRRPTSVVVRGGRGRGRGKKSGSPNTHMQSSRREIEAPRCSGSTQHRAMLVEAFHEHRMLNSLLQRLGEEGACPLRLLEDDGDWTRDQFWAVIKSLRHASRSREILKVLGDSVSWQVSTFELAGAFLVSSELGGALG